MVVESVDTRKNSSTSILNKSLVGILSQGLTWPLEYTKIIKQFDGTSGKSITNVIKNDIKANGILVVYRGLTPQIIASVPRFTIRFSVYETLNKYNTNDSEMFKFGTGLLAGGVESTFVCTPNEAIKMQMIKNKTKILPTMYNIYNVNGISGFWKGGIATISRQSTTQGISLYVNSSISPLMLPYLGMYSGLVAGMVGGVCAVAVNNPIDVIKTRQQESLNNITIRNEIVKIWKHGGISGFYRGALIRTSRVAPLHGLTYFFYDLFSKFKDY